MAKQTIGIGSAPNDGTGDSLRVAFDKANNNFTELYDGAASGAADLSEHIADDENPHGVTKAQVGLGNVTNDAQLKVSQLGAVDGVAPLDSVGKVPAANLPSYVDDVVEAANFSALPGTGETGKIYVTMDNGKTWRWSGSAYVEISATPAFASQAEAEAGSDNTKLMTPLRVAQAIAALGGGGGGAISTPLVFYVEVDGDDGTASPGDPSKPFGTVQAAYDTWMSSYYPTAICLQLGKGSFGGLVLSSPMGTALAIHGRGLEATLLNGINGFGASPASAPEDGNGDAGGAGKTIDVTSDHSVNLGVVIADGAPGADGGAAGSMSTNGGDGGPGGAVRLRNCTCDSVSTLGGNGGSGQSYEGAPCGSGSGGVPGVLWLESCHVFGNVVQDSGGAGSTGDGGSRGDPANSAFVVNVVAQGDITANANSGIVTQVVANVVNTPGGGVYAGVIDTFNGATWP